MPSPQLEKLIRRILPPGNVRKAARSRIAVTRPGEAVLASRADLSRYRNNPVGYVREVLKMEPTPDQVRILNALIQRPYRVLVKSGHNVGKTALAAMAVNWWYDTRDPSATISSAPTKRDVEDLLWTEVRLQRRRAGLPNDFIGPSAPEMRTSEDHYAKGYTASKGESFQGRHRECMFFIFDEAEGVDADYWKTAGTMFVSDGTHAFLAILNPTTTTSQSYQEERIRDADGVAKWTVFSISSLDHPNISEQLAGRSPPIPAAVTLAQVRDWLVDWFEEIPADEANDETDVEFPPGSRRFYRPGPDGESRVLGRRPSAGTYGVWSEKLWEKATKPVTRPCPAPADLPEIGLDVARFGDDRTEFHARVGPRSLHHEDHGGWDTVKTAERAMQLADELAVMATRQRDPKLDPVSGKQLKIKVDDTGVGGGVTDIIAANGYTVIPVNAGTTAPIYSKYERTRDQLWFETAKRARDGRLDLSGLPVKVLGRLESQAMAPEKVPMPDRRWRVESKEKTKAKVGRSPDGMDAVNLAYYEPGGPGTAEWIGHAEDEQRQGWRGRANRAE